LPPFRRREETLNDKLLREAGYGPDGTKPPEAPHLAITSEPPPPDAVRPLLLPQADALSAAASAEQRLGSWDAVAIAVEPRLRDDEYEFATVPDGSLIVDETCDEDLSPLADAVEAQVQPPYRARAVRQDATQWLVSGRRIQVVQLVADGDELELSCFEGQRTFSIEGRQVDPTTAPAELAALGERRGPDYAVHASRIDGDLWEIGADPL